MNARIGPHIMPAASRRERNILVRVLVSYRRWLLWRGLLRWRLLRSGSGVGLVSRIGRLVVGWDGRQGRFGRLWCRLVGFGHRFGVVRHITCR